MKQREVARAHTPPRAAICAAAVYNAKIFHGSAPQLQGPEPHQAIERATLSSSHMFAACRTILQQCVTDVTGLDSLVVGGRWSKNALPQEWLKFLEIGAQGKVISWKVRVACPEILVIISEALNNANDTNKIPSEAEFVKKMMGKALEQQRKFPGVQPDWAYIRRASFGGKAGTLAAKADDMMLFVAGWGTSRTTHQHHKLLGCSPFPDLVPPNCCTCHFARKPMVLVCGSVGPRLRRQRWRAHLRLRPIPRKAASQHGNPQGSIHHGHATNVP